MPRAVARRPLDAGRRAVQRRGRGGCGGSRRRCRAADGSRRARGSQASRQGRGDEPPPPARPAAVRRCGVRSCRRDPVQVHRSSSSGVSGPPRAGVWWQGKCALWLPGAAGPGYCGFVSQRPGRWRRAHHAPGAGRVPRWRDTTVRGAEVACRCAGPGATPDVGAIRAADCLLHSRHARRRSAGRGDRPWLPGTPAGERDPAAGPGGRHREELWPAARPALSRRRAGRDRARRPGRAGAAGPGPAGRGRHAGRSGGYRADQQQPGRHRGRGDRRRRKGRRVLRAVPVLARAGGGQRTPEPGGPGHRSRCQPAIRQERHLVHAVRQRALDDLADQARPDAHAVDRRAGAGRLRLCPGAMVARVHQPRPRLERAGPARRDRPGCC